MIRTLLAHRGNLARGALAFVLNAEDDIEVVAETERLEEIVEAAVRCRPDVTVLDFALIQPEAMPRLWALRHSLPGCNVLVLTEPRKARILEPAMAAETPRLGFLATDGPPGRLVAAVRKVACGEPVLDPDLVVSALRADPQLTPRETQVLSVAAGGAPVAEIAKQLRLSPGTVRNHLTRIIRKTGARTRIEAVRIAQDFGWI